MKKQYFGRYVFSIFLALMIFSLFIPWLLWKFSGKGTLTILTPPGGIVEYEKLEPFIRALSYEGFTTEAVPPDASTRNTPPVLAYLASAVSGGAYGESRLDGMASAMESEVWKRISASGIPLATEGSMLSSDTAGVTADTLSSFFGLRRSGWYGQYIGDPRAVMDGENVSEMVKTALRIRQESKKGARPSTSPCLILSSEEGRSIILEPGIHFDGKAPIITLEDRSAPLYGRFSINTADPQLSGDLAGENIGAITISFTNEGEALLRDERIPYFIPAAVERQTPFSHTIALNVDFSLLDIDTKSERLWIPAWFRTHFSLYPLDSHDGAFWRVFVPYLNSVMRKKQQEGNRQKTELAKKNEVPSFRAHGKNLWQRSTQGTWAPFLVKGINIGPAIPGKAFTEFPVDENLYYRWFGMIAGMNLNTIRVYTLLPPAFYRAFHAYNSGHPKAQLLLLQEIWPEEHPADDDYLGHAYTEEFFREIEAVIDAVHGSASIAPRSGRAWGVYGDDVSPWILGFLIGRELESYEVLSTDKRNKGYTYAGRFFSAPQGTPTEAWLASACDHAAVYESDRWGTTRPLSIVSWPTLDPIPHWVEWRDPDVLASGKAPGNDSASVDISHIDISTDFEAGFFGSYHIYPNYPDFIATTPWYSKYHDDEGSFRYGGYLREFMMFHQKYPALIAEYGISTSLGIAHFAPDGLHHGGLSEEDQGKAVIRMTQAALSEAYAGTVIFEWIDEWAKKTWTTEPFMIPYNRHVTWHNPLDPEQNYGLIAMESISTRGYNEIPAGTSGIVEKLTIWGDESYFHLSVDSENQWSAVTGTLYIALDTADRSRGITSLPSTYAQAGKDTPHFGSGCEFLLEVQLSQDNMKARLLASDTYNIGRNKFSLNTMEDGSFSEIKFIVNRLSVDSLGRITPAQWTNNSILPYGSFTDTRNCVTSIDKAIRLRIPWGLMNVSDPSTMSVIDDPRTFTTWPAVDELRTIISEGIIAYGMFVQQSLDNTKDLECFPWEEHDFSQDWHMTMESWNIPAWKEREKTSVDMLRDFFGSY